MSDTIFDIELELTHIRSVIEKNNKDILFHRGVIYSELSIIFSTLGIPFNIDPTMWIELMDRLKLYQHKSIRTSLEYILNSQTAHIGGVTTLTDCVMRMEELMKYMNDRDAATQLSSTNHTT